jgi:hypothetical protein
MKKTATFYYIVWRIEDQKTVRAGRVSCRIDHPQGITHQVMQQCKEAARRYVCDTGEQVGYTIGGSKTDIAKKARAYMKEVDEILYSRIVMPVPDEVKQITAENITRYHMELDEAFDNAARAAAKKGSELYKAWRSGDLRRFIPSEVFPEYLYFNKYPLAYNR